MPFRRVILLTADVAQIVAINLVFDGINVSNIFSNYSISAMW